MRLRAVPFAVLIGLLRAASGPDAWADASVSLGATGASTIAGAPIGASLTLPSSAELSSTLYGDVAYSEFLVRTPESSLSAAVEGVASYDPFAGAYGADAGARIAAGSIGETTILNAALFGNVRSWSAGLENDPAAVADLYGPIGIVRPNSTLPAGATGIELSASYGGAAAALSAISRAAFLFGEAPGWIEEASVRADLSANSSLVLSATLAEGFEQRLDRSTAWRARVTSGLTAYGSNGALLDVGASFVVQSSTLLTELSQLGVTGVAAAASVNADSFLAFGLPADWELALAPWARLRLSGEPTLLLRAYPSVVGGSWGADNEWEIVVPLAAELVVNPVQPLSLHIVPAWTAHASNSDYRRWEAASLSAYVEWAW